MAAQAKTYSVLASLTAISLAAAFALDHASINFWSSLLSNLAAGWVGSLVTIAIIDKLLARRKTEELQPMRVWFAQDMVKRLNLLIEEFLFTFERFAFLQFELESATVTQALAQFMQTLSQAPNTQIPLSAIANAPGLKNIGLQISQVAEDIAGLSSRMEEIERIIQLHAPILDISSFPACAKMSSIFLYDARKYRNLATFLRGYAQKKERENAREAFLDLNQIVSLFQSTSKAIESPELNLRLDTGNIVDVGRQIRGVQRVVNILEPILYP